MLEVDVAAMNEKAKLLATTVLPLFSSSNMNSRYLMLLELSIEYGVRLLNHQGIISSGKQDPQFFFPWNSSQWSEQFEFLVHIQSLIGKKVIKRLEWRVTMRTIYNE